MGWIKPPKGLSGGGTVLSGDVKTYKIDLKKWGIKNDKTFPTETTKGIQNAIDWAKSQGYNHTILPDGTYLLELRPRVGSDGGSLELDPLVLPSNFHFEMSKDCSIELKGNGSPNYNILFIDTGTKNVRISGGKIKGDKDEHFYVIYPTFERGGVNSDGSLNNDSNSIRCILDRYQYPGLLSQFRVWTNDSLSNVTGYSFYQYKDTVSAATFVNCRTDGSFAPNAPTGRGWFLQGAGEGGIVENNKMVITMDITNNPLTDTEINNLKVKIDNQYYTGESGIGVEVLSSHNVEIDHCEIYNCTGDGILTGLGVHYSDSSMYTQDDTGSHIYIHNNNIHHCRRNGISLTGPNDQFVYENEIHHIGRGADNISTSFRDGTDPMFGIDVESMVGGTNWPAKNLYYKENMDGIEVNFRIYIFKNYIYENQNGHFDNPDGTNVTVSENTFSGYNVGGVASDSRYMLVKYLDNTFTDNCLFTVTGDNYVNGANFFNGSYLKLYDIRGAVVQNVKIKDGSFNGSSNYGYFGMPNNIDLSTSTFTYSDAHGMGDGAEIIFEEWVGKAPTGIDVSKKYYTINTTTNAFQVTETKGGKPVQIYDTGEWGFNISRYNYGRCFISNVTLETDWYDPTDVNKHLDLLLDGAVISNVTVKNYKYSIKPTNNYVGRPTVVDNFNGYKGKGEFDSVILKNSTFIKDKRRGNDIDFSFGDSNYQPYIKTEVNNCKFKGYNIGAFNSYLSHCFFEDSSINKGDSKSQTVVSDSYIKDSELYAHWLTLQNGFLITRCDFENITKDINSTAGTTVMIDNNDVTNSLAELANSTISASPTPSKYNSNQNVILTSSATSGNIYYTIDGTDPTTSSLLYSNEILVSGNTTIKAISIDNNDNQSKIFGFRYDIDKIPPNDITNLVASPYNDHIYLSWTASTSLDLDHYEILDGSGNLLGTTTDTTFTQSGLLASTSYSYTIKSVDDVDNMSAGVPITAVTTSDTTPPKDVIALKTQYKSNDAISLTWVGSTSSDISSYDVYKDSLLLGNTSLTNYSETGLSGSTSYTFDVIAKDINGNASNGVSITGSTLSSSSTNATGFIEDGLVMYKEDFVSGDSIPNPDSYFTGTQPFTILMTASVPGTNGANYINRDILDGTANRVINFAPNSNQELSLNIHGTDGSGNDSSISFIAGKIQYNIYYHIAITRDSNSVKIYIKNSLSGSKDLTSVLNVNKSTLPLEFGFNGDAYHATTSFTNIAYYNRVLTNDELTQNYKALSDTTPPSEVTGLTATTSSASGIVTLDWIDPTDQDFIYCNAYYRITGYSNWTKANTTNITYNSFSVAGLTSGDSYDFQIRTVDNSANESSGSIIVSASAN